MATNETALERLQAARNKFSPKGGQRINVGENERVISAVGGGALAVYGLTRGSLSGLVLGLVGGALVYRGVTGHCNTYSALGVSTAREGARGGQVSVPGDKGIKVEKNVIIDRPAAELYRYWRDFENLPKFMDHLESVTVQNDKRSHWVAKAPAGTTVEWDAEIINEKENELIAWRSLEGADVDNAGSVRFEEATGGRGTVVKVSIEYNPPAGIIGSLVAKLFGEEPNQQVADDLRRFKQVMETGEIAKAQPQYGSKTATTGGGNI